MMAEIIISAILLGALYGLGALGMALIFGVMRVLNLAHGAFMVLGAVVAWSLVRYGHVPLALAIVAAPLPGLVMGPVLWRWGIARRDTPGQEDTDKDALPSYLLVTLGFSLLLEDLLIRFSSQGVFSLPLGATVLNIQGVGVSSVKVWVLVLVLLLFMTFHLILRRTDFGLKVRACIQDREGARLMGVSLDFTAAAVFAMGCAMAGLAGGAYLALYPVSPEISMTLTVKALLVVILGGVGRVLYTLAAAFFLGFVEVSAGYWGSAELQHLLPCAALLLVLLLKPLGTGSAGRVE